MNEKKLFITKPLGIGLLACLCCLLWGSATPAIKIGYEWFGINPCVGLSMRRNLSCK